jgi:16S rRNA (cytosine1402-N4)-methyltransferase
MDRLTHARARRSSSPASHTTNCSRSWLIRSSPVARPDGLHLSLSANFHPGREIRVPVVEELRMSQEFHHEPVMLREVLDFFQSLPPGVVLDATVGGGGHAAALLDAHADLRLIGLDQDERAVAAARERLARFGRRAVIRHARFDRLEEVLDEELVDESGLAGAFFDLGVSSTQLDDPERGFSFQNEGPLDMRMDKTTERQAADIVNGASEEELADLFFAHGEDRFSRRIARAIVAARPIVTTTRLAEVVADAIPPAARRRGHPARRVFQGLRVELNDELEILGPALDRAIERLTPGGRIVVLSYHSGEDRTTKERFALAESGGCTCPPLLPCVCGAVPWGRLLTRGARLPKKDELDSNPRASAARLRVLERLDATPRGQ